VRATTRQGRSEFIGRERERGLLAAGIGAALTGQGHVVLLAGEPGIGKTRLAEEVAGMAAARSMPCRWGWATDEEGSPPYWPFRQILRGLDEAVLAPAAEGPTAPEVAADVPPGGSVGAQERFRLLEAATAVLVAVAAADGLLVVVEDIQWADPSSLQLLVHLARGVAASRLVVLATYRDTETVGRDALRAALAALAREPVVTRVRLVGLTEPEVGAHLTQVTGRPVSAAVVAAVSRRTRGNPLFVAELGRLLAGSAAGSEDATGLPEGVREAVRERLGRLTASCREVVSAASALGSEVDPGCLAAVTGRDVGKVLAALDEAAEAGVVTGPGGCRFAHDLVREAARLELATVTRLRLHQRMAEYLMGRADAGTRLTEVAFHWLESLPVGDAAQAVTWAERAAGQAMGQLAWEEAADLYGRALAAGGAELGVARRCRLLLGRARAQVRAYDVGAARESVLAAADVARGAGDSGLIAQAAVILAGTSDYAWAPISRALCEEALAGLPEQDSPLRARLLSQLAVDQFMATIRQAGGTAGPLSESALAMAERVGDRGALVAALRARQIACSGPGGAGERLRLGERLLALGEQGADDEAVLWGRVWRFDALAQLGEIDRAEAELDKIAAAATRLRSPLARWHLLRSRGAIAFGRGRFDEALAIYQEAVALAERAGHQASLLAPLAVLVMVCVHTGRPALPVYPSPEDWPEGEGLLGLLALWHLAIGRREDARRIYVGLPPPETAPAPGVLPYLTTYAEFADAFGDRGLARDVYERLLPFADLFVCNGAGALAILGSARLPLGLTAATTGRLDEAVRHFRAAAEINDRAGLPPFAALARYQLARALARRRRPGDPEEAAALAASAGAIAHGLGMTPLQRRAGELAASLAGHAPGPLTAREREIAALVGHGLTNRQIAATAHISERTAENHVQHILTKLGFTNRAQIAAWVAAGSSPNLSTSAE
jgi:DNA-binding CsgD family transcriptional regulator/tetratricopeptide (TPR) repeat protein